MYSKDDVRAKLDEHIQQLLNKPSLSPEDYTILRQRLSEYPANGGSDWMWPILLMTVFSGFGKTEH